MCIFGCDIPENGIFLVMLNFEQRQITSKEHGHDNTAINDNNEKLQKNRLSCNFMSKIITIMNEPHMSYSTRNGKDIIRLTDNSLVRFSSFSGFC